MQILRVWQIEVLMNIVELQKKLIAAARANVPGDQVPYAFEKRVTALLVSRVAPDNMSLWVHGLWRAAVSCVAITLFFARSRST